MKRCPNPLSPSVLPAFPLGEGWIFSKNPLTFPWVEGVQLAQKGGCPMKINEVEAQVGITKKNIPAQQ